MNGAVQTEGKCEGSEAGWNLSCSWTRRKATVAVTQGPTGRAMRGELEKASKGWSM